MIYYDVSESRQGTNLPQDVITYGRQFDNLESITGADFVVLPEKSNYEKYLDLKEQDKSLSDIAKELDIPLSDVAKLVVEDPEYVLHEWLFAGAILVQRKSGYDFLNSMGPRLNESIAKMCEVSHKQYQRVVLVTGVFSKQDNVLLLDSKTTNYKYINFLGALSSIKYKGACVEFVASDNDILEWVKLQQTQLLKYKRDNTKWIVPTVYYPSDLPELDDPLQLMRPVRDARLAMVNVPGWGSEKVNILYEYVKKCLGIQYHPTLYQLLIYATAKETANHCKGIGSKLIQNARQYVGMDDGQYLNMVEFNITKQTGDNE